MGTHKKMVEEFQCPGCVAGMNIRCGSYEIDTLDQGCGGCAAHVLGTQIGLGNPIALGLPTGFNKPSINWDEKPPRRRSKMRIRLWLKGDSPGWDHLNVPVWAMEKDGFLFVRTFAPRVDMSWVDVIERGSLEMVPNAINVAEFVDKID